MPAERGGECGRDLGMRLAQRCPKGWHLIITCPCLFGRSGPEALGRQCPLLTAVALAVVLVQLLWTLSVLRPCWPLAGLAWEAPPPGAAAAMAMDLDGGELGGSDESSAEAPAAAVAAEAPAAEPAAARPPPAGHAAALAPAPPQASPLARVYVINVASAASRWQHMNRTLGPVFGSSGLPPMERFDAATPMQDDCDLPYSLGDCCTVSHMNVLRNFSADNEVRDNQWVLILEDDVALHPKVAPESLAEVIARGLVKADRDMSPFVYLGLCSPVCFGRHTNLKMPSGATVSFSSHCSGSCTHAYAVQKFIAPYVPEFLPRMKLRARTIDAALSLMAVGLNMSLLGFGLRSPDIRARGSHHAGVFYMKAFTDSLTTSSEWDHRVKLVFRLVDWSGRFGNLMFQWATVTAMAAKFGAETEAYFAASKYKDKAECPAASFFKHFRLQRFSRDLADLRGGVMARERCTVFFKEAGPNIYREDDLKRMQAEIATIRARSDKVDPSSNEFCKVVDVITQGYLQSWKYFDHWRSVVRRAYASPPAMAAKAAAWFQQARRGLERKRPGVQWFFVGVQVRRGDKVHDPNFAGVYFNAGWPYFRIGMRLLEKRLLRQPTSGKDASGKEAPRKDAPGKAQAAVAFVVTAGGSMNSNVQDVAETREALKAVSNAVLFTNSSDPLLDFAILSSTDGIIISPGSFGWWAAYMSPAAKGKGLVVAPQWLYQPQHALSAGYSVVDYYPPNWEVLRNNVSDGV